MLPKRNVLARHPNVPGGSVSCRASLLRPSYVRMAIKAERPVREYTERRRSS